MLWLRSLVVFCLFGLFGLCGTAGGAWAQLPVPPYQARMTDLSESLLPEELAVFEDMLKDFAERHGRQLVVLVVTSTQPESIEQYARRVVEHWKAGRAGVDDGVLLLVAKADRRLRIEVGQGLAPVLSDETAARIIRQHIAPRFQAEDFRGGLAAGIGELTQVLAGGAPTPVDPALPMPPADPGFVAIGAVWLLVVLGAFGGIVYVLVRHVRGSLPWSLAAAAGVGGYAWHDGSHPALAGLFAVPVFLVVLFFSGLLRSRQRGLAASGLAGAVAADDVAASGGDSSSSDSSDSSSGSSDGGDSSSSSGGGASGSW